MANVVVLHVVYGWKPCHSSSSTPWAPSKTTVPARSRPCRYAPSTMDTVAAKAANASTHAPIGGTSMTPGASSGPTSAVSRSRSTASFSPSAAGSRQSATRGASSGWASA